MSTIHRGIASAPSLLTSLHRVIDAAAIAAVSYAAAKLTPAGGQAGLSLVNEWLGVTAAAVVAFHAVSELTGVYRSWRGARLRGELGCLAMTWAYTVALMLGIGLVTAYNARFSYESKVAWIVATPLVMVTLRSLLRLVQRRLQAEGWNTKRVAICGANELGVQLARNLAGMPELGLKTVGFYDDRYVERRQRANRRADQPARGDSTTTDERREAETSDRRQNDIASAARKANIPTELGGVVGGVTDLVAACRAGEIDTVYLTFPMRAENRLRDVLNKLADTTADVYLVPDFFVFELLHARLTNVGGLPAVSIHENPLYGVDGLLKRAFDLVAGLALLVLFSPVMIAVALAVKLTSRGPVFFRQKRYGLDGREIRVWKFRSMRVETCQVGDAGTTVQQATKGDARITPVGAFIRKTSLDELPQLFNVVGGSMSLVGPRPHATAHNEQYRTLIDGYMLRHKVKPGITGLAQVMGFRGETDTLDKMEGRIHYDHEYIRTWSFTMDVEILFRTLWVVLGQKNAY
ncbi:undecaprenyl-phosphate glucose phosphotransferase [Botrimarina mediterranea]|uniref:UDP-glucose:undecaprenyl-phosphate glucose-1-phosphate transferase n=1 Tax=Botrimarina mediterranea TaxID=2528022 RepID=A0A518K2G9_9BACT|nr:undecaprenyl-phosphate glucose phosphotransferase [Botrimarina mediterranea]QDV72008.1 UDP-glucose:undecaprenyl-phosphate glucose-1-phosphate transferase [Botrimarina mediterranea]QDV76549.1 UDP-glucose:undecaprenyl-phosphate glucose-1-phosphate transferase [Planctomycetes bacterium K2D]